MKHAFGTFLISRPDGILNVRSVDDLRELTEGGNATEGIPEIEKIEQLNLSRPAQTKTSLLSLETHFQMNQGFS